MSVSSQIIFYKKIVFDYAKKPSKPNVTMHNELVYNH